MLPSLLVPLRTQGDLVTARARPARPPIPGQMTLDDWAEVLTASPQGLEAPCSEETSLDAPSSLSTARTSDDVRNANADTVVDRGARHHPVATALLVTPEALLTRSHLRELGLERR